jgi:Tfp pilus assembly protein FimT
MKQIQGTAMLTELVVALSMAVILVMGLGFYFRGWTNTCRMEGEIEQMYYDLLMARAKAMERNRNHFFVAKSGTYEIYEDTNDNAQYDADADNIAVFSHPETPTIPHLWTGVITIDTKGLARTDSGLRGTIRFDSGENNLDHDCIVVWATRINLGKWDGERCIDR